MLAIVIGFISLFSTSDFNRSQKAYKFSNSDTVKLRPKQQTNNDSVVYVQIQRIFIIGNKITHDRIILRELSVKSGDIVSNLDLPAIMDRDQKRIFNTRLFNRVNLRTLELESGKIDLLIDVDERWYTFPSPRFDLSDRNFNEWWQNYDHDIKRVVYGLKLYQYNMRGRNETLLLTALFGFQRNFAIGYRIPYIDKKQKQGLSFNFEFIEAKNLAFKTEDHKLQFINSTELLKIKRTAVITYSYRNSFYGTHALGIEYQSSWINDTINQLNKNYFNKNRKKQKFATLKYQFTSDHRDVNAYPLVGHLGTFILQKSGLGLGDDVDLFETNLTFAKFIDLNKGFYFSNYTNVFWSTPKDPSYANYDALGSLRPFVKGYEIYVIEGPYYFLNKSTFKKRIFSRKYTWKLLPSRFQHIPISIYLKTYGDFAYVGNYAFYKNNNLNTRLSEKVIAGGGGGVDIVASYDLVLRLEYTLNAEGTHGFFLHIKKEF